MFTGLVEDMGRVTRAERRGDSVDLEIEPDGLDVGSLALGDSVSIDGVCLTVTGKDSRRFRALAAFETLRRSTLGTARPSTRVNLERALQAGERLGGHIVAGHVDGIGDLSARRQVGPALELTFRAPREVLRYVVEKGSIAIDGISLTVNRVDEYSFAVAIIPHTMQKTTLADKQVGAKVNLEVDIVGKYVEKFVKERFGS